jgi:integrase
MPKITKRLVESLCADARDVFVWDEELRGFGVRVKPSGFRSYVVQYRNAHGRSKRLTVGEHGRLTAEEARKEARRVLAAVERGEDPAEERKTMRAAPTVAELCEQYLLAAEAGEILTSRKLPKKGSTLATDRGRIVRHIIPLLGAKKVAEVGRDDVERFLRDVAAGKTAADVKTGPRGRAIVEGGRGTATRTVGLLGGILSFAVKQKMRTDNPVRGVERFADRKMDRFLSPQELARLGGALAAAESDGVNAVAVAAIRLLLFSGARKSEILTLRWADVDFYLGILRLADSKTGAKVIYLGAPALEVLASLPRLPGNPYVLPGDKPSLHLVGLPKVWERIRVAAGLPDVRLHDLRHSFASVGASGGDSLYIVGALLGHADAKTTQRYAHLSADPIRQAADRISGQIAAAMGSGTPGEVVPIRRVKS